MVRTAYMRKIKDLFVKQKKKVASEQLDEAF